MRIKTSGTKIVGIKDKKRKEQWYLNTYQWYLNLTGSRTVYKVSKYLKKLKTKPRIFRCIIIWISKNKPLVIVPFHINKNIRTDLQLAKQKTQ